MARSAAASSSKPAKSKAIEPPAKSKASKPPAKKAKRAASIGSSEIDASDDEEEAFKPGKPGAASSDDGSDEEDAASAASDEIDEPAPSKKRKAPAASSSSPAKGKGKAGALAEAVPAGQISQRTLDFLGQLRKPECNDRDWFQSNDATFRAVEREWNAFVGAASEAFTRGDWTLPVYPAKNLVYRIYRDVRKDKTPYKTNMSASFSRTGRKGPYAGYYLAVASNGKSMIAGGKWGADKNDLATIRTNINRNSKPLRKLISAPEFEKLFGKAKSGNGRSNIFGRDDELKNAPKGVKKDDENIDLLRLRSFVVSRAFSDADVLKPDFMDKLVEVVKIMAPFVQARRPISQPLTAQYINDLTHPQSDAENDDDAAEDDEEAEEEDE